MIKIPFPLGLPLAIKEEIYEWIERESSDICMLDIHTLGFKNEEDIVMFKLKFGNLESEDGLNEFFR